MLEVVPREAQRDPAGEERAPVAPAISAHRAVRAMRVEPVELDEHTLAWPHLVGLDELAVQLEMPVDDRLGNAGTAQGGEEPALEEASRRAALRAVGGEEGPQRGGARPVVDHALDDV